MDASLLLRHLGRHRRHFVTALENLPADAWYTPRLPSGWTFAGLVSHLTHDDERFWVQGVIAGDPDVVRWAETSTTSSWVVPPDADGSRLLHEYRTACERSDKILLDVPLASAPAWWPAFMGGQPMGSVGEVVLHLLGETATHAGHLDAALELLDGRQHLVVD